MASLVPLATRLSYALSISGSSRSSYHSKIYLERLSKLTGANIYGKAEFQNPGGSVKDRAAMGVVENAEKLGLCVVIHFHFNTCPQNMQIKTRRHGRRGHGGEHWYRSRARLPRKGLQVRNFHAQHPGAWFYFTPSFSPPLTAWAR
jgi:hypothetical protein